MPSPSLSKGFDVPVVDLGVAVVVGPKAKASGDFAFVGVEFVAEVFRVHFVVGVLDDCGSEVNGFEVGAC